MPGKLILLIVEMLLDVILCMSGIVLIVKANDNQYKFTWGILCILLGVFLFYDNSYWLNQFHNNGIEVYRHANLLSLSMILQWYISIHTFTLFVLGSFRPGYMTISRILVFSLPVLVTGIVLGCFWWFGEGDTPLASLADIGPNLGRTDVQLRLAAFMLSILTPLINIILPLFRKWTPLRKPSKGLYIYIASELTLIGFYIVFTLDLTEWIFFIYGYIAAGVPLGLALLYLNNENPFSLPPAPAESGHAFVSNDSEDQVSPVIYLLHQRLVKFTEASTGYTNPDYTVYDLASELNTNQTLLIQAIRYGGFSSFREYINHLRLNHFKHMAAAMPGTSIKELMFRSGFTSRSSFYRYFSEQESISPKKYLEQLYQERGVSLDPAD